MLKRVSALPAPGDLKKKFQSVALLDAILMRDWEFRYFSFNAKWSAREMMASMRDGEGSEVFFLFDSVGAIGKIYSKSNPSEQTVDSLLAQIPNEFSSFKQEAAFNVNMATCYLWCHQNETSWSLAPKDIVGVPFLSFVADFGEDYKKWAEDYYEVALDLVSVGKIFHHDLLTEQLIVSINPDANIGKVFSEADGIGYRYADLLTPDEKGWCQAKSRITLCTFA